MANVEVALDFSAIDQKETNDDSSVDTQDAFLEMLGLTGHDQEESLEIHEEETESKSTPDRKLPQHSLIPLPRRCSRFLHPPKMCLAFTIDNFYSKLECEQLISIAATIKTGFRYITEASHVAPDGTTFSVQLQNPNPHKLSVFDHPPTVDRMWRLLKPRVEPLIQHFMDRESCGRPLGLNPRLRVLRYDSSDNDRFEPHFDATTMVGYTQKSLLTVLLYLNDGEGKDFEGGSTLFLDSHISIQPRSHAEDEAAKVTPKAGTIVIFEHDLFHSSVPLLWGTKYVLRTDILFAVKEEAKVFQQNISNHIDSKEQVSSAVVSDLCEELNLSDEEKEVLESMDMLEITLESFLSPGIALVKNMLKDVMNDDSVERLVHSAARTVKK